MNHVLNIADSEEQAGKFRPPPKVFDDDVWTDEDAYNDLIVAKAQLLKEFPFWGILGLTIKLIEIDDPSMPTLATDGMHVFYNPTFCKSLTKGERVFAIAHELFHGLFEHAGRNSRFESYAGINWEAIGNDSAAKKDATDKSRLWNFAADFIVNDGLVEAHVGEFIKTINILHDPKFRGWAVEEVYEYLLKHPEEAPPQAQCLDQHIEIQVVPDGEGGEGGGNATTDGEGNIKVTMTESEFEALQKQWQDTMFSAATAQNEHELRDSSAAGCIPSAIQRIIDELSTPKVNWRTALRRAVSQIVNRRYTFKTPNKALFSQGWTMPGFRDRTNKLDIAIFVDTSGSVGKEQLTAFISEIRGMMNAFPRYKIHAHCFDGAVCEESVITLEKHNGAGGWDHLNKFAARITGGGGTDFMCNWHYLKARKIKPRMIIMLTDGFPYGEWGVKNYAPTIFFMMGNNGQVKAPFGTSIHYEDVAK
jgi:predicted metal-dependent peptidase